MPTKDFLELRERLAKVDAGGNLVAEDLAEYLRRVDAGEIPAKQPGEKPQDTFQTALLKGAK